MACQQLDIEKAFLYASLDDSDRDFTRFFWLSNPEDPESEFQVYCFKTFLLGSASFPFMLNATLATNQIKTFCAKFLHKISFITLAKKIFWC